MDNLLKNKPGRHCQSYKTILSTKHHEHIVEKLVFYLQCKNNPVTLAYSSNDEQKDTNLYHYCFCSTKRKNYFENQMKEKNIPFHHHQTTNLRNQESESRNRQPRPIHFLKLNRKHNGPFSVHPFLARRSHKIILPVSSNYQMLLTVSCWQVSC